METMLSAEDLAYRNQCRMYAAGELTRLVRKYGEINYVPDELRRSLGEAGFFKYLIPEEHGGLGVSAVRVCLAREILAGIYSPADVTLAMQGLGSYSIVMGGTKEQKQKYLPGVASGERLTTYALTEPNAGSDVNNLQTIAEPVEDAYTLTGRKRFISNGHSADMAVIFAKTPSPENPRSISAFVVEKGVPGYEVERRLDLIAPHDIVSLKLDRATIPKENLVGNMGDGYRLAMQTLYFMRTSVGAAALGMGEVALKEAMAYAQKRVQFGSPLASHQAVGFKLAEMATELEASRLLIYRAAIKRDRGAEDAVLASSMAKLYATEAAWRVIDQAVQVHGGVGLMKGSTVERLYREIRSLRIYEGTSEIQKLVISRALLKGAKRGD
jgi:acyl-CoA dehydrogenase